MLEASSRSDRDARSVTPRWCSISARFHAARCWLRTFPSVWANVRSSFLRTRPASRSPRRCSGWHGTAVNRYEISRRLWILFGFRERPLRIVEAMQLHCESFVTDQRRREDCGGIGARRAPTVTLLRLSSKPRSSQPDELGQFLERDEQPRSQQESIVRKSREISLATFDTLRRESESLPTCPDVGEQCRPIGDVRASTRYPAPSARPRARL